MKNLVITYLVILICLTAGYGQTTSQTPIRIWKVGTTSVFVANPATDPPLTNSVATYGSATEYNVEVSLVNPGGIWVKLNGKYNRYTPDKFLDKNFTPWGTTAAEAVEAYLLSGSSSQSSTAGADGKTILSGTVAPTSSVGTDGDYYYNRTTTTFYGPKASGAWPAGVVLVGATGPTGSAGIDGKTILSGTTAPSSGVGTNGDVYINTATTTFYGPKTSGSWPTGLSLIGPQGPAGGGNSVTITNNLTTTSPGTALDAVQGKRLSDSLAVLRTSINSKLDGPTLYTSNNAFSGINTYPTPALSDYSNRVPTTKFVVDYLAANASSASAGPSGVGDMVAVPNGTTNGAVITMPSGAKGVEFLLQGPNDSVTFTVASTAPSSAPANTFTVSGTVGGTNWWVPLSGVLVYITSTTGTPKYRAL